jgi:RNA polymerase sigma factor (TIGR02999 family)
MGAARPDDLSELLGAARAGREGAADRLVAAIYAELRRMADGLMRHERPGHTLQPSDLVHEALLRLLEGDALAEVPNRRYLFAAAARAMRQVLVDHARRRRAARHGGERARRPLDDVLNSYEADRLDLLALDEALDRLAAAHQRPALVIALRFFCGLSVPEVAEVLEVSDTTAESDWRFARAWLRDQLGGPTA